MTEAFAPVQEQMDLIRRGTEEIIPEEELEQKLAAVRCYATQFPPGKQHVFDRIRGAAMIAGAAANFAAGETFVSTRPLGSLDLVKTVLPRMQAT